MTCSALVGNHPEGACDSPVESIRALSADTDVTVQGSGIECSPCTKRCSQRMPVWMIVSEINSGRHHHIRCAPRCCSANATQAVGARAHGDTARTHFRRCFMDLWRSSTPSWALLKASTTCFMRAFSSAVARLAFASLACDARAWR